MKRLMYAVIFSISLALFSCDGDEPEPDITLADLDKRLDGISV